jgi:hypothetical protein
MKRTLAFLSAFASITAASAASAADAVMKPITQFIDSVDKGDAKGARAAHIESPYIVDEVAPHYWSGKKAFDTWLADYARSDKAAGITDEKVTLSPATREVVSGRHAYVIVPAVYTFKQKGVPMSETGAQMSFVLLKTKTGWKIASWTWTGPAPTRAQ